MTVPYLISSTNKRVSYFNDITHFLFIKFRNLTVYYPVDLLPYSAVLNVSNSVKLRAGTRRLEWGHEAILTKSYCVGHCTGG
jgi:hypothetical protein